MHWHVIATHFPLSLFAAAFGFQVLHLFASPACFDLASNIMLLAGLAVMLPTTLTGWLTWKSKYKGAWVPLFRKKIMIACGIILFSAALISWRLAAYGITADIPDDNYTHWIFLVATALPPFAAMFEGMLGGRLNHR